MSCHRNPKDVPSQTITFEGMKSAKASSYIESSNSNSKVCMYLYKTDEISIRNLGGSGAQLCTD